MVIKCNQYLELCCEILQKNQALYEELCYSTLWMIDRSKENQTCQVVNVEYNYLQENLVANGNYGQVFRTNEHTVDKVITLCSDKFEMDRNDYLSLLSMTIRECAFMKSLIHPNLIQVKNLELKFNFNCISQVRISMPYYPYTLKEYLCTEMIDCHQVHEMIGGIYWMHHLGVYHCDLSLENIMVDESKNLIVTDLGISLNPKLYHSIPLGTFEWSAPEMWCQDGTDHWNKVDVWAVGIICLNILFQRSMLKLLQVKDKSFDYFYQLCCFLKRLPDELTMEQYYLKWKDHIDTLRTYQELNSWPEMKITFNENLNLETKKYLLKIADLCLKWDPEQRPSLKDLGQVLTPFKCGVSKVWISQWHYSDEEDEWREIIFQKIETYQQKYKSIILNRSEISSMVSVLTCQMRHKMDKYKVVYNLKQWIDIMIQFVLFVWYNIKSASSKQCHIYFMILKSLDFNVFPTDIKHKISIQHKIEHDKDLLF